jgi:sugar/nucleoside kinase (ribokinase family)
MNDRVPRVLTVGDLTADLIIEVPELPIEAEDFLVSETIRLEPGGSANLLILMSRLGVRTLALGAVGTDLWGEQVFKILEEEGVEVSPISRQGSTTVALVLVDAGGHHSFVGSFGKGKPMMLGEREKAAVAEADALFTSGYSLREARLRDITLDALDYAGKAGIPRFFDPGPAFQSLEPEVKQRALASCDVLLLTEVELGDLSPAGAEAPLPRILATESSSPPGASDRAGPHTVVVKRGAEGCRVFRGRGEKVDVPGLNVTVRDTTAAGDCFDAGYLLAYLKGRSPVDCARLANCAGAAAVQKVGGGRNVPTHQEMRRMILQMDAGLEM